MLILNSQNKNMSRDAELVKKLLETETQGKKRIAQAREENAQLVKEAKDRAHREIEAFQRQEEAKLVELQTKNAAEIAQISKDLEERVAKEVNALNSYASSHIDEAAKLIVKVVLGQ